MSSLPLLSEDKVLIRLLIISPPNFLRTYGSHHLEVSFQRSIANSGSGNTISIISSIIYFMSTL